MERSQIWRGNWVTSGRPYAKLMRISGVADGRVLSRLGAVARGGDAGRAPGHAHEIALRDELFVRLDDDATRQIELLRQDARGGEGGLRLQPTGADGPPQLLLELMVQR